LNQYIVSIENNQLKRKKSNNLRAKLQGKVVGDHAIDQKYDRGTGEPL
jgi:hypothetical protein